jgi:hypothetical protein
MMNQFESVQKESGKGKYVLLIILALIAGLVYWVLSDKTAVVLQAKEGEQVLIAGTIKEPVGGTFQIWTAAYDWEGQELWKKQYKLDFDENPASSMALTSDAQGWLISVLEQSYRIDDKGRLQNLDSSSPIVQNDNSNSGDEAPIEEPEEIPNGEPEEIPNEEPSTNIPQENITAEFQDEYLYYVSSSPEVALIAEDSGQKLWSINLQDSLAEYGENPRDPELSMDSKGHLRLAITMSASKMDATGNRERPFRFSLVVDDQGQLVSRSYLLEDLEEQGRSTASTGRTGGLVPKDSSAANHQDSGEGETANNNSISSRQSDYAEHYGNLELETSQRSYELWKGQLTAYDPQEYKLWDAWVYFPLMQRLENYF